MSFKRTLIASGLLLFTLVCLRYLSHSENIPPHKPFSTFPTEIGEWLGKEERFEKKIYDLLGVDDSFLCSYRTSDSRQADLYVGFYRSQREGELIHSPMHCMPGGGWNIIGTSIEELTAPGTKSGKIKVVRLTIEKGAQKQIVLYWYQSRGRFVVSEYMEKIYLFADSITKQRTDGSLVRLMTPVVNGGEEKALKTLKDFAGLLIPVLQEYIPS